MQPDAGRRFAQPGATIRYLPQEPDLTGFATTLAYVEAGLVGDADEDRHRARYLLEQLGLTGDRASRHAVRRRGAACGAGPRAGADTRHSAAGRADQPPRPAGHRMAGTRAGRDALRHRADQPRPAAAGTHLARHRLAGERRHPRRSIAASRRSRRGATPSSSRRKPSATSSAARSRWRRTGCATASPRDASATRSGWPTCTRCASAARSSARGRTRCGWRQRRPICPAGWSMVAEGVTKSFGDTRGGAGFFHPHPARRPRRHRRSQRRRQDDAAEPADRHAGARCRRGAARHQPGAGDAGPAARDAGPGADARRRR